MQKAKYKGQNVVKREMFENNTETELADGVKKLSKVDNLAELYDSFVKLQPVIDVYFETNMIMDKNEAIKNNRLAQLNEVAQLAKRLGDLSKLVIK